MSSTDVDAAAESGRSRRNLLPTLIPILLATLGLTAALIAWRAGATISVADDANRAGLDAARARSAATVVNESLTTRTLEAFLDYERARRRAVALAAQNLGDEAQLDRMIATAHWFLVDAGFIDRNGNFQPDAQRQALMADAVRDQDLDPQPHFAAADKAWRTLSSLILAAIIVAAALPFLTLAQVTTGRLRLFAALIGTATMVAGIALMAVA